MSNLLFIGIIGFASIKLSILLGCMIYELRQIFR